VADLNLRFHAARIDRLNMAGAASTISEFRFSDTECKSNVESSSGHGTLPHYEIVLLKNAGDDAVAGDTLCGMANETDDQ
jgi:hypothetical protein